MLKNKTKKVNKKNKNPQPKANGGNIKYVLNSNFEFFEELKSLIMKSSPAEKNKMIKKIYGLGRIKLAVISGVFLNSENYGIKQKTKYLFLWRSWQGDWRQFFARRPQWQWSTFFD